jgi:hypothetical protein
MVQVVEHLPSKWEALSLCFVFECLQFEYDMSRRLVLILLGD